MRRLIAVTVVAVLVALLLPAAPSGAGAGATTDVYAVHGLNLAFQDSADDGGTNVTVCTGDQVLIPDFEFGQVVGPVPVPSGQAVSIQVYGGAGEDCANPAGAPLIDQEVTPTGDVVALVATSNGDQFNPELLPFAIDVSCVDPGSGRAVAAHAANAPEVDVVNTDLGASVGMISYGEQISGPLPAGTYGIEIYVAPDGPLVTSFPFTVVAGEVGVGFAVGNQPVEGLTPVVLIPFAGAVPTCEQPTTTTTVAPTTTTAAAQPTALQPTFTG